MMVKFRFFKCNNFQFVGILTFFPAYSPLLKQIGTARQYAPCGGQRAGRPTPYPRNVHT